jgi:tetratricopeptide (TPR) repeat protein
MLRQAKYVPISRKRRRNPLVVLILSLVLVGLLTGLGFALRVDRLLRPQAAGTQRLAELMQLWNGRAYGEVITRCDALLEDDPLNVTYLSLKGFASFYAAYELASAEDRAPYLEEAVVSLRRVRVVASSVWPRENDYVLGRAYFLKGKYYYNVAATSLEQALAKGYKGEDTYEYLGAAYERLGYPRRGLEHYLKAANDKPSDALYLTIAMVYFQLEELDNAEEFFLRAKNETDDVEVAKKSRFMLASVYLGRQEYIKAEREFRDILALDAEAADAYFGLGEVERLSGGDQGAARAMYRMALIKDPTHVGAKYYYYGR